MSVFTTVTAVDLERFLADYPVGRLIEFAGIADGIDNTNYFVTTEAGGYVLTLFEHYGEQDLDYFLGLLALLAEADLPCAHPLACRRGLYLHRLNGKPAALVERLPGVAVDLPSAAQCAALGGTLGRIHAMTAQYPEHRENKYGLDWFAATAAAVTPRLPSAEAVLIATELEQVRAFDCAGLPNGVIHADLFRDNALFVQDELTGVIDFYTACGGVLLYDVAICANDWCVARQGTLDLVRGRAFMDAYHAQRPLLEAERDAWPVMLRAAALRFWLSRLYDKLFPRAGDLVQVKNPDHFRDILLLRARNPTAGDTLWPVNRASLTETS